MDALGVSWYISNFNFKVNYPFKTEQIMFAGILKYCNSVYLLGSRAVMCALQMTVSARSERRKVHPLRKYTIKDTFRCLITMWSIGIAKQGLNELIFVKTSKSDLYPIYFHIWMRPESDLAISECMRFFPVYTVIEQIRSVSHYEQKIGIGSLTDSVNDARVTFSPSKTCFSKINGCIVSAEEVSVKKRASINQAIKWLNHLYIKSIYTVSLFYIYVFILTEIILKLSLTHAKLDYYPGKKKHVCREMMMAKNSSSITIWLLHHLKLSTSVWICSSHCWSVLFCNNWTSRLCGEIWSGWMS